MACCVSSLLLSSVVIYIPALSFVFVSVMFFLLGFIISAFVLSFSMIREIHPSEFSATSVGFMNAFNAVLCAGVVYGIGGVIQWFWDGKKDALQHNVYSSFAYHAGMSLISFSIIFAIALLFFINETACGRTAKE